MESEDRIPLRKAKFTVQQALAYHNLQRSFRGLGPLSINEVARLSNVSPTTVHRTMRSEDDPKSANALSLDLATRLCSVLRCEINDLITVEEVEGEYLDSIDKKHETN